MNNLQTAQQTISIEALSAMLDDAAIDHEIQDKDTIYATGYPFNLRTEGLDKCAGLVRRDHRVIQLVQPPAFELLFNSAGYLPGNHFIYRVIKAQEFKLPIIFLEERRRIRYPHRSGVGVHRFIT